MHAQTITPAKKSRIAADDGDATVVLEVLRKQAAGILGMVEGIPLAMLTNTVGNFPYYWQVNTPQGLGFNIATYEWINHHLLAGSSPMAQDTGGLFDNLYLQVISAITYSLSTADQAMLTKANQEAQNQVIALVNGWQDTYGQLPPPQKGTTPLDQILNIITTSWANPATDLPTIAGSSDLTKLLNKAPASGMPLLPLLVNYLNAIESAVSLQNESLLNSGILTSLRDAVNGPAQTNGALQTNDPDQPNVPAWEISPLADIVNGLQNPGSNVGIGLDIERSSQKEVTVNISGQASFSIPVDDLFTVNVSGQASYFSDHIAKSGNKVSVSMSFPGVTLVQFSPSAFDAATRINWYSTEPIMEAIQNGDQDVSGYKFSPNPGLDFSANGPFGFLIGLAISTFPTITITVQCDDYDSIAKTFDQSATVQVSFLGIPMASGSESSHSASTTVNSSESTVTITLTPPVASMGQPASDNRAWVLGAAPIFPAAGGQ